MGLRLFLEVRRRKRMADLGPGDIEAALPTLGLAGQISEILEDQPFADAQIALIVVLTIGIMHDTRFRTVGESFQETCGQIIDSLLKLGITYDAPTGKETTLRADRMAGEMLKAAAKKAH
jgi:hypothetical protein